MPKRTAISVASSSVRLGDLGGPVVEDPAVPCAPHNPRREYYLARTKEYACCVERMSRLITCFFSVWLPSRLWELISEAVGFTIGSDYESVAKYWLCDKKF
jgi:hypothetical protein